MRIILLSCLLFLVPACAHLGSRSDDVPDLDQRLAKFSPVLIQADTTNLTPSEKDALDHLIEAARSMQPIFLRQAWARNPEFQAKLKGTEGELFAIHVGLWDRLDEQPFVGDLPRPEGAGYYPSDMTKEEFETFLAAHPDRTDAFKGLFTMIERDRDGNLTAVPYSQAFEQWLEPAAAHLLAAAAATDDATLRRFCESRAAAFLSDDYYQSDMDWMDLDSPVEITIGPYETYEDRMFGYKAAFEAFVTVADSEASSRLAIYKSQLPAMERNLPIPDEHKNLDRGTESPIRVVDVVYTAGDTRAGVQTIAFNLPNDERVREAKGSKKVLLRNVIQAKFDRILKPIASRMLCREQLQLLSRKAFSDEVLFHELSHGLGPGQIVVDGRETEVRLELKELYSPLEEAKADIVGMYNALFLMEQGLLDPQIRGSLLPTWLAGLFRSIRFGTEEAHGKAAAIQFNSMLEKGAIVRDDDETYAVDFDRFDDACRDLVREICMLQATGDYAGTKEFFHRYGEMSSTLAHDLERIADIPVDIRPRYEPDVHRP